MDAYSRAAEALPTRAEALYQASRYCRLKARYQEGYQLAKRGLAISLPPDALFVEPQVYEFGLLDELSLNAYWSGHHRESLDAALKILATAKLSASELQRVVANAQFAAGRLPAVPNLGSLGTEDLVAQHPLPPPRLLHSNRSKSPYVLVTILAGQDDDALPLYLSCIEALDYPKSALVLYIREHNVTDGTAHLLRRWVERVGDLYASVDFKDDLADAVTESDVVWERDLKRSRIAGHICNNSLFRATELGCAYNFIASSRNLIRPCTLRELVALDLPIVAPFLRSISPHDLYSNYHAEVDINGYYAECDQYMWILNRRVRGIVEVPVVNGTVLIRGDQLNQLTYEDGTSRHEYVIMAEAARRRQIPQYLDNRQLYGYILPAANLESDVAEAIERAGILLASEIDIYRSQISRIEATVS